MMGSRHARIGGKGPYGKTIHPVGTIRPGKGGTPMMKVAPYPTVPGTKDNWRPANRVIWERAHGKPVPDGHVIVFCDHDIANLNPENLLAVPRRLLGQLNGVKGWHDMETTKAALEVARLKCAIADRVETVPLTCTKCGAPFAPHGATARRGNRKLCPECTGKFLREKGRI